ncbi:MAG: prepilin peptidase [Clostridia bacterium]|nr:prepilin peptidase [Clostridia bacterium]
MVFYLELLVMLNMYIIGALFGSFFSLATYRIPRKQDIVATRSYCPNCKHNLGFFDLIPVLSYAISLGKCRYCGQKISIRYFLMEILNGLIFLLVYLFFGYTFTTLFILLLYICMFLVIGSYIMKSKMSEQELEAVRSMSKSNSKKGVFVSELIVAMIIFTIFLASALITSRNYNNKMYDNLARTNATNIAVSNVETLLATKYDFVNSYTKSEYINGITYNVNVEVTKYSDEFPDKLDLIKVIEVKVTYLLKGINKEFAVKTLKERTI